jgi:YD repeat-containing protein
VYHWLHTGDESTTSRVLESLKKPLENRIWYNYPDQAASITFPVTSGGVVTNGADNQPTAIGRVLDNGTTQLESLQYNAQGNVTVSTDAVGRQTTYTYVSGDTYTLTDDNLGRIIAVIDPAGSTTRFTYDAADRVTSETYPDGATAHYAYHLLDLASYTDPLNQTTQYS